MLANDGATTTANLFGLDLISQDDGSESRVLLADGLGSVRMEIVGEGVETTTTYDPYGKLLVQTGSSGTTYGYTGEQEDAATGLVYLRARYYNPSLKVFMSRDPFPGIPTMPATQHGYSYAHNNPINLTDPSGEVVAEGALALCVANPLACGIVVVGGVVIVGGIALAIHIANNPPQISVNLPDINGALERAFPKASVAVQSCTTVINTVHELAEAHVNSLPEPERKKVDPWWPRWPRDDQAHEIFYRFIPTKETLSVVAGQYSKLWVPPNKRSQENFISQDLNYVNNLAMRTAAAQNTSMTVLRIFTKPGTFDYLTNPINARLHTSVNKLWLMGEVNFDVTSYQTFHSGDGSKYLQLKEEKEVLTIGFFQANTHKLYFEHQIDYIEAVNKY
ncbi:MAG: RHS repeat-associated core domain-containing protein [Ardenticatenaceae bacterium]|nr:RHS repeat-associated core domain-containing protein [Anaerolineales bacterium]MCB8922511.1 RHS repeat-associated core domain-containing protein [Ardenticatenaceae bacterium]MCB8989980.1 RHS repeat-associated core domain-containing protein [Ardenticatenaceae bacterium]